MIADHSISIAVRAALDLHEPKGEIAWTKPTAEPEQHEAYRLLNVIRASILDNDWPKKIYAFRRLYELPINPRFEQLPASRRHLQRLLLTEEFNETLLGDAAGDLPETVDGLLDLIYVALGWLVDLGLTPAQINMLMEEVHASNMTKVDSSGKPVYNTDGKVLKGEHYVKANVAGILSNL